MIKIIVLLLHQFLNFGDDRFETNDTLQKMINEINSHNDLTRFLIKVYIFPRRSRKYNGFI